MAREDTDSSESGLGRKSGRRDDEVVDLSGSEPQGKCARMTDSSEDGANLRSEPTTSSNGDLPAARAPEPRQIPANSDPIDPRKYTRLEKLGSGTYGHVYLARDNDSGENVAIKQMRTDEEDGVPQTALREVALLKSLKHENVVEIKDVLQPHVLKLWVVLEYVPTDLKQYLDTRYAQGMMETSPELLAKFSRQLLDGLRYCHKRGVLHRDLKPQNLLIDNGKQMLKIADFGLARSYSLPTHTLTHEVVTLWYRAPEILLGMKRYDAGVDMWSTGCILSEMATGQVLFGRGESEVGHMMHIFQLIGTATHSVWPAVENLEFYNPLFPQWKAKALSDPEHPWYSIQSSSFVNMLQHMLVHSPTKRISARDAMEHFYFDPFFNRSADNMRRSRCIASPAPEKWRARTGEDAVVPNVTEPQPVGESLARGGDLAGSQGS